jgi:hypothetical protein
MPDDKIETSPKKGETAAQFKERIEETRRELERQKALTPEPVPASTPAPAATAQAPAQVSAQGNVAQAEGQPPAKATSGVIPEVDEWWAKKGFKTPEDIANSYRELERELTRKNQELRNMPQGQPPAPQPMAPPQGYPPYVYPVPPQQWVPPVPPPYAPPVYAPPPVQAVEQLAEQYGLAPEDFKKVYAVANDLSKVNVQAELNRIMPGVVNQMRQINQDVTRQREMVDLMSEPTWKNPQVQFEMHKVLNEDPTVIQRQALPYRYAHDEALKRIARVNLGGSTGFQTPTSAPASSGSRPPATAGGNGKGSEAAPAGAGTGEISPEQFAALPLKEKREFLQTLGAIGR